MQQYLARYAETEASEVHAYVQHAVSDSWSWRHVLCIPAFAEESDFLEKLTSAINRQNVLIILVVNASENADPGEIEQTRQIAVHLDRHYSCTARIAPHIQLLSIRDNLDVLLVERCSSGLFLAEKEGVGLARKIACDIACQLISMDILKTPWIHSTDADAVLPHDYFQASVGLDVQEVSAGIYPFHHTPHVQQDIHNAQQSYDLAMNYYVAGLKWAGSPWAFHTIGSTLLINAQHYVRVRGFPKRQAGEDFYLLNKLGKTGHIVSLQSSAIELTSRLSNRVPFGTGPALEKIIALKNPSKDYLFYHPECFRYLKCWLAIAKTLQPDNKITLSEESLQAFINSEKEFSSIDGNILYNCLKDLGLELAIAHAFSHSKNQRVMHRHLHNWFDAFKTLKFIHWLRDRELPSLPLAEIKIYSKSFF